MKAKLTVGRAQDPTSFMAAAGLLTDEMMEILEERKKIVTAMNAALLRGDNDEALELAPELTGIPTKRPTKSVQSVAPPAASDSGCGQSMEAKQTGVPETAPELNLTVSKELLDVAMEIARERAKIELAMKEALLRDDEVEALEVALELAAPSKKEQLARRLIELTPTRPPEFPLR
jgi:hypothetical protein